MSGRFKIYSVPQSFGKTGRHCPRYSSKSLSVIRTGWNKGDGADRAFLELLGSEKVLDEKKEKRAEARAKKAAEAKKAMEEAEAQAQAEGAAAEPAEGGEKKE